MKTLVSGGFDPLHIGHVRYLIAAADYGKVYVALNSDAWLIRKKGFCFMPFDQREEILCALVPVYTVIRVDDSLDDVSKAIIDLRPNFFANGGDRTESNRAEHLACAAVNCRELFHVGGGKIQSSSWLTNRRMA